MPRKFILVEVGGETDDVVSAGIKALRNTIHRTTESHGVSMRMTTAAPRWWARDIVLPTTRHAIAPEVAEDIARLNDEVWTTINTQRARSE